MRDRETHPRLARRPVRGTWRRNESRDGRRNEVQLESSRTLRAVRTPSPSKPGKPNQQACNAMPSPPYFPSTIIMSHPPSAVSYHPKGYWVAQRRDFFEDLAVSIARVHRCPLRRRRPSPSSTSSSSSLSPLSQVESASPSLTQSSHSLPQIKLGRIQGCSCMCMC